MKDFWANLGWAIKYHDKAGHLHTCDTHLPFPCSKLPAFVLFYSYRFLSWSWLIILTKCLSSVSKTKMRGSGLFSANAALLFKQLSKSTSQQWEVSDIPIVYHWFLQQLFSSSYIHILYSQWLHGLLYRDSSIVVKHSSNLGHCWPHSEV